MTTLWCDNLGATYLSVNHVFHAYTKYVKVDYHLVCNKVAKQEIQVYLIFFKDQLVDFLPDLSSPTFSYFLSKLSESFMRKLHFQLEGAYYRKYNVES